MYYIDGPMNTNMSLPLSPALVVYHLPKSQVKNQSMQGNCSHGPGQIAFKQDARVVMYPRLYATTTMHATDSPKDWDLMRGSII